MPIMLQAENFNVQFAKSLNVLIEKTFEILSRVDVKVRTSRNRRA